MDGTSPYFYGKDHLGSIHNLTDATGALKSQLDYGPYGELTELTGKTQPDFAYVGLFYHQRSGLYFAEYRAYDGGLKRWLNRDPIGENGGLNLYAYVLGNPVRFRDPQGTCIPCIIAILLGLALSGCSQNPPPDQGDSGSKHGDNTNKSGQNPTQIGTGDDNNPEQPPGAVGTWRDPNTGQVYWVNQYGQPIAPKN